MASAAQASDKLRLAYDGMSEKFACSGLDVDLVKTTRQRYAFESSGLTPVPYAKFPTPLGSQTVRLIVIPIVEASAKLAEAISALCKDFQKALPAGTELYANVPERWHITVFHTSKFDDTRPNPLEALTPDLQETESGCRPLPSAQALQCEQQTIQEVVRQNQPLHLEVHKVLLADSGTLLVCLVDRDGGLYHLREQLTKAFPAAPTRQTQIIHVSVLRLLTAQQLNPDERERLQAVCDASMRKLKGMQIEATTLWYIHETVFSNIEGKVHTMNTS